MTVAAAALIVDVHSQEVSGQIGHVLNISRGISFVFSEKELDYKQFSNNNYNSILLIFFCTVRDVSL